MSRIIRKERIEMKEWVSSRGIVCCTKEIELLKWIHPDGRLEWKLDICAYGQWWCESFDRKLDAYRMLRNRGAFPGLSGANSAGMCAQSEVRQMLENESLLPSQAPLQFGMH